jgi:superfamily II DNA or RNA helicase
MFIICLFLICVRHLVARWGKSTFKDFLGMSAEGGVLNVTEKSTSCGDVLLRGLKLNVRG